MEKPDTDTMKEIIMENNALNGLKADMEKIGFNLPEGRKGEKRAYQMALKCWKEIRETEFPLSEILRKRPKELLFTEVDCGNDMFKIYGITHGIGVMNKDYRNIILKNISHERSYFEDGFLDILDITPCRDSCEEIGDLNELSLKSKAIIPFAIPLLPLGYLLSKDFRISYQSAKDSSLYFIDRELTKRLYLPEPLTIKNNNEGGISFEIRNKRSEYMANFLKNLRNPSGRKLNISLYAGLPHEPQIDYLLKSDFGKKDVFPSELTFYKYEK